MIAVTTENGPPPADVEFSLQWIATADCMIPIDTDRVIELRAGQVLAVNIEALEEAPMFRIAVDVLEDSGYLRAHIVGAPVLKHT